MAKDNPALRSEAYASFCDPRIPPPWAPPAEGVCDPTCICVALACAVVKVAMTYLKAPASA